MLSLAAESRGSDTVTIVSETGRDSTGPAARKDGFCIASWTQTRPYFDVSITARLFSAEPDSGVAYLTTRIGPGATLADQIASASFLFPPEHHYPADVLVFSGLTLAPGTYYLIIAGGSTYHAGWYSTDQPTVTTDVGVTQHGAAVVYDFNLATYLPASVHTPEPSYHNIYSVTGTAVPEPSGIAFIVGAGFGYALFRRTRSTALDVNA